MVGKKDGIQCAKVFSERENIEEEVVKLSNFMISSTYIYNTSSYIRWMKKLEVVVS